MKQERILFETFRAEHIEAAVELSWKEFEQERISCLALPGKGVRERLKGLLGWLSNQSYGMVAISRGKLVGYLAFAGPWEGFHGRGKGVFSPLGGSAFEEEKLSGIKREKLASMLFAAVAEELVQNEIFSCGICRYAHDEEVGKSFVFNGFGIRCSDAVKRLSDVDGSMLNSQVQYEELHRESFREVAPLQKLLIRHLSKAPVFFPTDMSCFEKWFEKDMRVFVAKVQGELVGFISVQEDGENFITKDVGMANICGACFKEEFRGSGMAEGLLDYVCDVYRAAGIKQMGVDYETLNPTALRFWGKNFTPYTYSYVRRFDERIKDTV